MKVMHYQDVSPIQMAGDKVRGVSGRVLIGKADDAPFCMRIFEIAAGGHTPLHAHEWAHEMFFHQGQGHIYRQGQWVPVGAGSVAFVPPGAEHQVRNSGSEPLLLVCLVPEGAPEL